MDTLKEKTYTQLLTLPTFAILQKQPVLIKKLLEYNFKYSYIYM